MNLRAERCQSHINRTPTIPQPLRKRQELLLIKVDEDSVTFTEQATLRVPGRLGDGPMELMADALGAAKQTIDLEILHWLAILLLEVAVLGQSPDAVVEGDKLVLRLGQKGLCLQDNARGLAEVPDERACGTGGFHGHLDDADDRVRVHVACVRKRKKSLGESGSQGPVTC